GGMGGGAVEARISRITATVSDEETPASALEWLRESYWLKAPAGVWKRAEPSPPPERRPRRPGSLRDPVPATRRARRCGRPTGSACGARFRRCGLCPCVRQGLNGPEPPIYRWRHP